jgi:hypothetical protein
MGQPTEVGFVSHSAVEAVVLQQKALLRLGAASYTSRQSGWTMLPGLGPPRLCEPCSTGEGPVSQSRRHPQSAWVVSKLRFVAISTISCVTTIVTTAPAKAQGTTSCKAYDRDKVDRTMHVSPSWPREVGPEIVWAMYIHIHRGLPRKLVLPDYPGRTIHQVAAVLSSPVW